MTPRRIFNAFRPAHEARAALAWLLAACHAVALAVVLGIDGRLAASIAGGAAALALWRGGQARALWRFKVGLAGSVPVVLPCDRFDRVRPSLDGKVWLGWGFRWQPEHTQLCHDLLKRSLHEVVPPRWMLRLSGRHHDPHRAKGLGWVHGLAPERDVVVPMAALEGHTAVLAVTGALKTVLARLLVYQLASRGDAVFVLDPKGDKGLEQVCRDVAARLGDPSRFARFHAAFPSGSFRFDALANWDRETQVASRIRLLMGGAPDDPFNAFVWATVTDIVRAMKRLGRRVTLQSLLDTVRSQDAAESLAEAVLQAWFEPFDAGRVQAVVAADRKPPSSRGGPFVNPRLAHWAHRFRHEVPPAQRPPDITSLLAALEADRGWFAKMVVGLTPVLMRLTAGDLGPLLSPDHADVTDPRPVHTTRQLIEGRRVVYFGLDALSDTSVAEGLAALFLSDLAATAGDLYNHGPADGAGPRRVHVLCDEWGDLVCEPVVQLANKGRGAGIVLYLFGQTVSDLVVKLGDEARAKRVLGNMNNLVVGATSDTDTLDYVTRKLGDTVVRRTTVSQGAGQKTEDAGLEYAATRQASVTEQALALVPPQVLAGLPDLHYVAIVNRAQVFKGRIPVLDLDPPSVR